VAGIGADAKCHLVALANAGIARGFHHESGSIRETGVEIGSWAQVLQGIDVAL
jgi:hypothetical protein